MISSFPIFGVTFHLYGMFMGLAMIVVAKISELQLRKYGFNGDIIWSIALWVVLAGLIGARSWHVVTDWHLYKNDMLSATYIWQGGVSILGALAGGAIGLFCCRPILKKNSIPFIAATDSLAVGLPFGQAIGRLGNWVNQELYGYPTDLPWKLFIDRQHRVADFEEFQYFHPLFAYEGIALLLMGAFLWRSSRTATNAVGRGRISLLYLLIYSAIRFCLEFLRIEKATVSGSIVSINQVVVAIVFGVIAIFFLKDVPSKKEHK